MGKKCIICNEEAKYTIKGSSEYYCGECAEENFSDIDLLQKVDEQAKIIKELIKEKSDESLIDDNEEDIKED